MTFYQFVEDTARKVMEWAQYKQYGPRPVVDEIKEKLVYKELRTERAKQAILS